MSVQTRTTALQNEIVRLYATFENDGRLANAAGSPVVEILNSDGVTVLDNLTPTKENEGIFYVDWYVPADLPLGDYYDRWTYQWSSTTGVKEMTMIFTVHSLESYINFISRGVDSSLSDRAVQMMKDLANDFIYEAMHIPAYWEQGMRVRQENQAKRVKNYYYFTLDEDKYMVDKGAVYSNNNQSFTVFEWLHPFYSSSSSSSESVGNTSSSSSSSSSVDSSSSSSSSTSSSSSISSESLGNASSSSSSGTPTTTTSTTTWYYKPILTCVGTANPSTSGVLTKVSGVGPNTIVFESYTRHISYFSTVYDLAYRNWNVDPRPIVRVNNRIVDDGWYADFDGRIYFDGMMAPEDSVNVAYNFAYFSQEEILAFLDYGLQMMNATPPASWTYSNLSAMDSVWVPAVLLYAAITALKRLVFGLNFQEKMIIFGEPEQAQRAMTNFQSLYQEYNTLWLEVSKDIKKKLPAIAQYVTPEYTLPGGRCMSSDTFIKCMIDRRRKEITIKDLFKEFQNNSDIKVLSMDKNNKINYVPIGKIWESGKKLTYILETANAKIRLSKEHMVYIPDKNKYIATINITNDDSILIVRDDVLVKQKLIRSPYPYKTEDVFDIEVPITENFIGNNIVSHNSRWFRYLYKMGS